MLVELNEKEFEIVKKILDEAQLKEAKELVEAEEVVKAAGYRVVRADAEDEE